jgi:hypothetical protein
MGKAGEKQKRTPKMKDTLHCERFVETARKLGCDESEETFEQEFAKFVTLNQAKRLIKQL